MSSITQKEQSADVQTHYPAFFRTLLEQRGLVTQEEIAAFLYPDFERDTHNPFLLKNMEKAVERIWEAVENKEKILIYGDYDADGVCASAILSEFFRTVEHAVGIYMPDRQSEGHGLHMKAVEGFIADGVELLITLDCGVGNHGEIALATEADIDVIVVDHHQVIGGLPNAYTVINPHQEGDSYPFKHLCGGALSFKLFQSLVQDAHMSSTWREGRDKWLLDLVALSTVADMMRMSGENRALVRYGLFVLAQMKRPGLKELCRVARVEPVFDSAKMSTNLNEITLGFMLGPRINAASRMAHAGLAYDLLMAPDARSARAFALELEENNQRRKKEVAFVERDVMARMAKQEVTPFIVEQSEHWPIPLLGLVAGKVADQFGRPVMLIDTSGQVAKASMRAPDGFDLVAALESVAKHLIQFGGHPQAAGCTFEKESIDQVRSGLISYAAANTGTARQEDAWNIECELGDLTLENAALLELLAPFGEGNPTPRFLIRGSLLEDVVFMGKQNNHAKLHLRNNDGDTGEALLFFHNGEADKLSVGTSYDIVGELSVNEWKGRKSPQLKIVDIHHAQQ